MATQLKKTVKPSGGDYTTLNACLAANQQNLVTADKYFDIEIDGDWSGGADTTAVTVDSYTTDATRYINIYTTITARHKGQYSDLYYRLEPTTTTDHDVKQYRGNITYNGIQFTRVASTSGDKRIIHTQYLSSGDKSYYLNCIFKQTGTSDQIIQGAYFSETFYVINCIFYDFNTSSANYSACIQGNGTGYIYNCSFVDSIRAYWNATGISLLKNCGESNMGNADNGGTQTTCSTSTPTFAAGTDNFHLASTDTTWHDQGTDLSADANYQFNTDIDGETRVTWDIGADEYVATGAATGFLTTNKGFWGA